VLQCLHRLELGMEREGRMLYGWFRKMAGDSWVAPGDCTACGECESRCTQRLSIIERMARAQELLEQPLVDEGGMSA